MKKILFILKQAPHNGTFTPAMLDIMMTVAAFDQEVSILLLDKAVFQLKNSQDTRNTGFKDTAAMFKSLPVYDIYPLYIEKESLEEHGLANEDISEAFTPLTRRQLGTFFQQFDLILPG